MNSVNLVGRLSKEPEFKEVGQDSISYCKFSIAVNRNFGKEVDFFNIETWRKTADNCYKYLSKGKQVGISGSIQNKSYEDNNGNKRTYTSIVADRVDFLSPKNEEQAEPEQKTYKKLNLTAIEDDDSDLPF